MERAYGCSSSPRREAMSKFRRWAVAAVAAIAVSAAMAPTASAEYFIGRGQAESNTRDAISKRNDVGRIDVLASCRPQGRSSPQAGYIYHRWTCGFLIRGAQWDNCDDPAHEYYGGGL